MKKLVLASLIGLAPLSFAVAGEPADKKAAAPAGNAQTAPIPDWDTRKAGEGMDLKAKSAAPAEK